MKEQKSIPETHKEYMVFIKNYCHKNFSRIPDVENLIGDCILKYLVMLKKYSGDEYFFAKLCQAMRFEHVNHQRKYGKYGRTGILRAEVSIDHAEHIAWDKPVRTYPLTYIMEEVLKQYKPFEQKAMETLGESPNTLVGEKRTSTKDANIKWRVKRDVKPVIEYNRKVLEDAGVL